MMDELLIPFHYGFMTKAMTVGALVGGTCGLLSCFITLKGWSLVGDALSHAIVPGVALAYLLGVPFAVGAFFSGLLAALGMGLVRAKTQLREDAVIGVVFTGFFALGLMLISIFPSGVSLNTIVLGNILGISDADMWQVAGIALLTLGIIALKLKDLMLFCFDPIQARAIGLNVPALHFTLLTLLAATAVAALQAVGAILVVATLITPGATAHLLTDRFGKMLAIGGGLGAATGFLGAYGSYFLNASTGGTIVVLQTGCFLAALLLAPKHGLLAGRARRRRAAQGGAA